MLDPVSEPEPLVLAGGSCYSGEMPAKKKSCKCAVHHHGGFTHGPADEVTGYCFDCFIIKECQLQPYKGPPCKWSDSNGNCTQLQGHAGPHSVQQSLL